MTLDNNTSQAHYDRLMRDYSLGWSKPSGTLQWRYGGSLIRLRDAFLDEPNRTLDGLDRGATMAVINRAVSARIDADVNAGAQRLRAYDDKSRWWANVAILCVLVVSLVVLVTVFFALLPMTEASKTGLVMPTIPPAVSSVLFSIAAFAGLVGAFAMLVYMFRRTHTWY